MMTLALLRDVFALTTTFVLAGALFAFAVLPEPLGAWCRLQLSLALSVPATLALSLPAVVGGILSLWTTVGAFALLASVAAWRTRGRLRALAVSTPALTARIGWPRVRLLVLGIASVALAWVLIVGPQIHERRPDAQPLHSTPWYYWWLADGIADDGGIPPSLPEWGTSRPFQRAYVATSIHTAATMQLGGGADFALL